MVEESKAKDKHDANREDAAAETSHDEAPPGGAAEAKREKVRPEGDAAKAKRDKVQAEDDAAKAKRDETRPEDGAAAADVEPKAVRSADGLRDFVLHAVVIGFLALYFAGLLLWFGNLFFTGGAEEHAVMSIVIPVLVLVGSVSLITLSSIALAGRKVAAGGGKDTAEAGHGGGVAGG